MFVQGILSGVVRGLSAFSPGSRQSGSTAGLGETAGGEVSAPPDATPVKASALRRVADQYDVTRITPREFSELVDRLRRAKALPEGDLQELAGIRVDLEHAGIGADEEIDLVDFYRRRLAQLEAGAAQGASPTSPTEIERTRRRLDWVVRLALMHREPEAYALA